MDFKAEAQRIATMCWDNEVQPVETIERALRKAAAEAWVEAAYELEKFPHGDPLSLEYPTLTEYFLAKAKAIEGEADEFSY